MITSIALFISTFFLSCCICNLQKRVSKLENSDDKLYLRELKHNLFMYKCDMDIHKSYCNAVKFTELTNRMRKIEYDMELIND